MPTSKTGWFLGAAIVSAAMAGAAVAQDAASVVSAASAAPVPAAAEPAAQAPVADAIAAPPIDEEELGAISGGEGVVVEALSNQQLTASNSGSVEANQVVTGDVDFSTGDYSGIGNFVVNTGNNNNLQGVISVNIATAGGP